MRKKTLKQEKDWFRLKRYPHIGLPLEPFDRKWVQPYVTDKSKIAVHGFSPFIHRKTEARKFRREICHDGTRSKLRKPACKERELFYASHIDSNVYSYYSHLLAIDYEKKLQDLGISDCVTAYRRLKLNPTKKHSRNKCNVDFANEVFNHIKTSKENELVAVTLDIKGFFDNLNHKMLKKSWRFVIDSNLDLPPDHYNVYRNITKFSYVEENQIFEAFRDQILVEREPNIIKNFSVKKKQYLRNKRAIAYCDTSQIENIRKQGLIRANKYVYDKLARTQVGLRDKGIPQGSPISSTLANVYLISFDKAAHDFLTSLGGIYRRYSDDMVIICRPENEKDVIDFFSTKIHEYGLEFQTTKTQVFRFVINTDKDRFYCFEKNLKTNKLQSNTNFEYLGFQFDGKYVLLKNSSVAGYFRKMKKIFARGFFFTYHNNTKTKGQLFKARLYKRFTYLGATRRRIYSRDKTHTNRFVLSHKFDWGNYLTYAALSANIIPDNKIERQLKNHWNNFHRLVKKIENPTPL